MSNDRTEKENDGQYAEDDRGDYSEENLKFRKNAEYEKWFGEPKLTLSQKIRLLANKVKRFAESIQPYKRPKK